MNRLLRTYGHGHFIEESYDMPNVCDDEITVKTLLTGICRSDIDMMNGNFPILPASMQGHEGLGLVIDVGVNLKSAVKVGDIVATRGEPAFADYYNVRINEFVVVPDVNPKYIIEPVACGLNILDQAKHEVMKRVDSNKRIIIFGSGFLAWVVYNYIKFHNFPNEITIVGNSNINLWGDLLSKEFGGKFDIVIDLSGRTDILNLDIYNKESLLILGNQKMLTSDFSKLLWQACTIIFPSPRHSNFYKCMQDAVSLIEKDYLNVDNFWTKGYNRNTEWQQAFTDSVNRTNGFNRAYLKWV